MTCVAGGRTTEEGIASDGACTFVALIVGCEGASLRGAVMPALLPVLGVEDDCGASDGLDFSLAVVSGAAGRVSRGVGLGSERPCSETPANTD